MQSAKCTYIASREAEIGGGLEDCRCGTLHSGSSVAVVYQKSKTLQTRNLYIPKSKAIGQGQIMLVMVNMTGAADGMSDLNQRRRKAHSLWNVAEAERNPGMVM